MSTDRGFNAGIVLVALGLLLLAANWLDLGGGAALVGVATVFLVLYAGNRRYGFLVPGMILGGLAIGVAVQSAGYDPSGSVVVLGLATGFIGVYVVDTVVRGPRLWWPLIPGGILAVVATTQLAEGTAAASEIARLWPLGLIVAGVLVLLANMQRARAGSHPAG